MKKSNLDKTIKENKKLIKRLEIHIKFGKVFCILSIPYLLSFVVFSESMRIKMLASLLFVYHHNIKYRKLQRKQDVFWKQILSLVCLSLMTFSESLQN